MRTSVASLTKKLISTFFAATLALGLVPAAALAVENSGAPAPQNSEFADANSDIQAEAEASAYETNPTDESGNPVPSGDPLVIPSDSEESALIEQNEAEGLTTSWEGDQATAIPAAMERVNEDVVLQTRTVAQAEATRSFFLAETLENTRTIPMVSANLPLDTGSDVVDAEGEGSSPEDEGDTEGDDPDSEGDSSNGVVSTEASDSERSGEISPESTVVGSFTYLGMTFAIEAGGESVALVAVDYNQLPEEYVEKQIMVVPDAVTADGIDYYSVTRIADNTFASLTKENADPDYVGCAALFTDEELLAEAGIDASEAEAFLNPESDMIDLDGDGEMDTVANPLKDCTGILAMSIPASVSSIEDKAFSGFDTLQYLVISEDNQQYASYDGALYSADLTNLRLIPEGRVGSVRVAPSATTVDPEAFSHCPSVDTVVADPGSGVYEMLSSDDGYTAMFPESMSLVVLIYQAVSGSDVSMVLSRLSDAMMSVAYSNTSILFETRQSLGVNATASNLSKYISAFPLTVSNGISEWTVYRRGSFGAEELAEFYGPLYNGSKTLFTVTNTGTGNASVTNNYVYYLDFTTPQAATFQRIGGTFSFKPGVSITHANLENCTNSNFMSSLNYLKPQSTPSSSYNAISTFRYGLPDLITYSSPYSNFSSSSFTTGDKIATSDKRSNILGTRAQDCAWHEESTDKCSTHGKCWLYIYPTSSSGIIPTYTGIAAEPLTLTNVTNSGSYQNSVKVTGDMDFLEPLGSSYATTWFPGRGKIYTSSLGTGSETTPAIRIRSSSSIDYNPSAVPTDSTKTFFGWNTNWLATASTTDGWYSKGGRQIQTTQPEQVLNLYAIYDTKTSYTVTLNRGSGSGGTSTVYYWKDMGFTKSSAASDSLTYGSGQKLISTLPTPPAGHKFTGYYSQSGSGGKQYVDASGNLTSSAPTLNGNTTWYAQYEVQGYTVSFNANNGTGSMASKTYSLNASHSLPECTFTRAGYHFLGWDTSATATTVVYEDGAEVNNLAAAGGSVTLYAVWEKNAIHKITLDSKLYKTSTSSSICSATTANTTAIYCWVGKGWYTSSSPSDTATAATTSSALITIPKLNGYKFDGYYLQNVKDSAQTTQKIDDAGKLKSTAEVTEPGTWYAKWSIKDVYTVELNSKLYKTTTGSAVRSATTSGTTAIYYWKDAGWYASSKNQGDNPAGAATANTELIATLPTLTGYDFGGYWSTQTGTGTQKTDGKKLKSVTSSISGKETWYAKWTAHTYTVTLDPGEGASVSPTTVAGTYDKDLQLPTPSRLGYDFQGWNTQSDGSGTTYQAGTSSNLTSVDEATVSLHAQWKPHPYKMTIVFDEGDTDAFSAGVPVMSGGTTTWSYDSVTHQATSTYTVEDATVTLPSFTLDGYNFEITGDGIEGAKQTHSFIAGIGDGETHDDLTYTFKWLECPYTIEFSGVKHVTREGNPFPLVGGINRSDMVLGHTFDLDELVDNVDDETANGGTYDTNRYTSFVGWKLARTENDKLVYLDDTDENPAPTLSIGLTEFGDDDTLYVEPVFVNREWKLKLASNVDNNSVWPDEIEDWTKDAEERFERTYDCASGTIPLPSNADVTRFGYEFTRWIIQPYSDEDFTVEAGKAFFSDVAMRVPADSTYNLLAIPDWTPKTSKLVFDVAADDTDVDVETFPSELDRALTATFAAELPLEKKVSDELIYLLTAPQRDNYSFLGFFDEAGRQYYGEDLRTIRAWDKEPATAPDGKETAHTLYAHWRVDEPAGDADPNVPSKVVAKAEEGAYLQMGATAHSGRSEWILDTSFSGLIQWDSANDAPAKNDTVTVDVTSFATDKDAETFARELHAAFDYKEGEDDAAKRHYVVGFEIPSTGCYVSLEDIVNNNHILLVLKGSDLDSDIDLPSLSIGRSKVRAVYADTPPILAGELAEGEDVVTMFDAGAGSFRSGRITYVKATVGSPTETPVELPEGDPYRAGYDFCGYSAEPQVEHDVEGCAEFSHNKGTIPFVTSRSPMLYYAHWQAHTYDVVFDLNFEDGNDHAYTVKATYDDVAESLTAEQAVEAQGARGEGYELVGWFDTPGASGGTMVFDRDGAARGVWSIAGDEPTVYARWVFDTGDDPNVLPPASSPHIILAEPARLMVSVPGYEAALDGTYKGVFRFDVMEHTGRPSEEANVQVTVNAYEPAGDVSRKDALAKVERELMALAPTADKPYLQGFRVASTGDFISWGAIVQGESFDIDCMGYELIWDDGDDAVFDKPADAHLGAGSFEVVYGPNPSYPPFDEDAEDIKIVNVFDAGVGTFANGKRLLDVRSTLGESVTEPSDESDLALPGNEDPTYMMEFGYGFVEWVDAEGRPLGMQDTTSSRTFYARYVQDTHLITFVLGEETKSIVNYEPGDHIGPIEEASLSEVRPYHNKPLTKIDYPIDEYKKTFWRDGYDFLGWFSTPTVTEKTVAYFRTPEGIAYEEASGTALGTPVGSDDKMTGDLTMYGLWAAKTYTVTWHNNYPDYVVGDKTYKGTKGDPERDVYRLDADPQVRYGQQYDIPVISRDEWRFVFDDWFMTDELDDDRDLRGQNHVSNDIPTINGTTYFLPSHFRSLQRTTGLHYYAAWTNIDSPIPHKIYLHAGAHGFYANGDAIDTTYTFIDTVELGPTPSAEDGWVAAGWVAAEQRDDEWVAVEGARTESEVPQGTTGVLHYVMQWEHGKYSVRLSGLEDVLETWETPDDWKQPLKVFELGDEFIAFPSVDYMREHASKTGHMFMGWSLTGEVDDTMSDGIDPRAYIAQVGNDTSQVVYKTVWKPIEYTVVFDSGSGDVRDTSIVTDLTYDEKTKVVFPIPTVRSANSGVFGHWGLAAGDKQNNWAAESELPITTLVEKRLLMDENIDETSPVSGMFKGELVEDREFSNVITVHGVWTEVLSIDYPLQVLIAIDPDSGDMVSTDAWLRTSSSSELEVMGLTYDKTAASEDGGGTDTVFDNAASKVSLAIRPVHSSTVADDADEEEMDAAFAEVDPFPLNLGKGKTYSKNELGKVFPTFGKDGTHLKIRYRLAFDESVKDLKSFLKNLPENDAGGINGWSSEHYPIARLYYTVGLADQDVSA